jgi:acetyl-CoA acyltransferase 1
MTAHYGAGVLPERISDDVLTNQEAQDVLIPMGITSENVAKQFGIGREEQDRFAVKSFEKASKAKKDGLFKSEIVPTKVSRLFPPCTRLLELLCYLMLAYD